MKTGKDYTLTEKVENTIKGLVKAYPELVIEALREEGKIVVDMKEKAEKMITHDVRIVYLSKENLEHILDHKGNYIFRTVKVCDKLPYTVGNTIDIRVQLGDE